MPSPPKPKTRVELITGSAQRKRDDTEEIILRADKAIQHAKELAKTYERLLNQKSRPLARQVM